MSVQPGTIVALKRGGMFDEVTHFFVRTPTGYVRLEQTGGEKGVARYQVVGDEAPESVTSSYDSGSIVTSAPTPGQPLANNVQVIGLPDGTKILSPTKKVMVKRGDGVDTDGKHFNYKYVADMSDASTACRLMESETKMSGDILDRLRDMLNRAGLSDEKITAGATLKESGAQKVARKLMVESSEVNPLIHALSARLRENASIDAEITEALNDAPRFSFEKDRMHNVTVRDNQTGKSAFLRGSEAAALLNRLDAGGDPQALIAKYVGLMEDRAMTADQEDQERERPHRDALARTGFYGKQGAGCIVLAHDTGRVLLAHRSADVLEPGTWGNWGGAVDEGVSPKSHALKELYEETGYQGPVESTRPLLVFEKGAFRYSNYLVVVPTEFEPELNWEADGYRWCEINEWPQPLHYGLKALFSDSKSINVLRAEVLRESAFATEAKARLDALPEGFTDWVHELPELPEGIPEVIGEGANSNVMLDEDDSFHHEIHSAHGSYNFPWRADGQHGYATARYKGRGREMKIDILSIRTDEGEEIEDAGHLGKLVHEQAIAFIGQE